MKNEFLKLTSSAYSLLEFFPESDPLKNRAKNKVLAVMENLVLISKTEGWASFQKDKIKNQILEDIDILLGYFQIGKSQGWLNSVNYLIISNEYQKIKKEVNSVPEMTRKSPGIDKFLILNEKTQNKLENTGVDDRVSTSIIFNPSERQRKIIEFLSKNEKAQVMDLQLILPEVTKRTIRRDLDELLKAGKIERFGEFNQVIYRLMR